MIQGNREIICIGSVKPNKIIPLSAKSKAKLRTFMTELGVKDLQTLQDVKDKLDMTQLGIYCSLLLKERKFPTPSQKVIDDCLKLDVDRDLYYSQCLDVNRNSFVSLMFCKMNIEGCEEIVCVGSYPGEGYAPDECRGASGD